MKRKTDAVVVGAGPNGLTAAIVLAAHGLDVTVLEAAPEAGGGLRSLPMTLPGFLHDHCAAVHPMGVLSPIFKSLRLENHGLRWIEPPASAAHPLDGGPAVLLERSIASTAAQLGIDGPRYESLITGIHRDFDRLLSDILTPPSFNKSFFNLARFGQSALFPATGIAKRRFQTEAGRALFAGCAAHSILPLDFWGTSAVALVFLMAAHSVNWPIAAGGSQSVAKTLEKLLVGLGGKIECNRAITRKEELPDAKLVLFDLSPHQVDGILGNRLPKRFRAQLHRYQYGPSVFKIDYALSQPIPWSDPACLKASTVHVGGSMEEIATSERSAWDGSFCQAPFVMVCQQSQFDPSRAPKGTQTGYAYCHVPFGSTLDYTQAIESQIERFAPSFKDCVLARHVSTPQKLKESNPALHEGVITGGAATLKQILFRPSVRLDPYSLPLDGHFICSHSTPPGGGVHGMCGFNAARSALKQVGISYSKQRLEFLCDTQQRDRA